MKLKLTPQKINFYFYVFLIFFGILITYSLFTFLYKNFYETITQSEEILILQGKVIIETVDINKFNEVIGKLDQKIMPQPIINFKNPFLASDQNQK